MRTKRKPPRRAEPKQMRVRTCVSGDRRFGVALYAFLHVAGSAARSHSSHRDRAIRLRKSLCPPRWETIPAVVQFAGAAPDSVDGLQINCGHRCYCARRTSPSRSVTGRRGLRLPSSLTAYGSVASPQSARCGPSSHRSPGRATGELWTSVVVSFRIRSNGVSTFALSTLHWRDAAKIGRP